ncbi:MAG TPA: hypothetical protein VFE13_06880 [Caulobacteraceae bacterium]|nr:hypothetical protein [Caulobacteraceae bacterium]
MAEFSASDAAFTGFRIVAQRPWIVAVWAALLFVFTVAQQLFVAYSAGDAFKRLAEMSLPQPGSDPSQALDLFRQVAPTYLVLLIASLVLNAVVYAAMNRAVMQPQESRFGYLRLAADELRQLGLFAFFVGVAIVTYTAIALGAIVIVVAVGLAAGGDAATAMPLMLAVLIPTTICAFIFIAVRFSLASAMTFDTHRIDPWAAWRMTRGRFWPLFGAYFIAFALSFVVAILSFAIAMAAVAIVGGIGAMGGALQSQSGSVSAVLTPAKLAFIAVSSLGQALIWPVTMTPAASIYRALAPTASRVFD